MEYKYLEHTADVKFVAYGKDLEDAFRNSLRASMNVMTDIDIVKPEIQKKISIESRNAEALLYDFIEELLFLFDSEAFITSDAEIKITKEEIYKIEGTLKGDLIDKYEIHGDVKAVTYNDMDITKTDEGYEITVVLDI